MTNISKILPACGFAIGVALVAVTSAFKEAPKMENGQASFFWVLKSGVTTPTTNENDYQQSSSSCDNQIHFCGFMAPKDGTQNKPLITSGSDLANDLNAIASDPDSQSNTSGDIRFLDNE